MYYAEPLQQSLAGQSVVQGLTSARPKGYEEMVVSFPVPGAKRADLLLGTRRQGGGDWHGGSLPAGRPLLFPSERGSGTPRAHLLEAVLQVFAVEERLILQSLPQAREKITLLPSLA